MTSNPELRKNISTLIESRIHQEQADQILEARQIISEMEAMDTTAAFSRVQKQIRKNRKPVNLFNVLIRVAALLFIPLLAGSFWIIYNLQSSSNQHYSMQEITSPPGIRSQIVLPDGSKVWLNAESTIRFPIPFHTDKRSIDLQGEAFFEVVKNEKQPFEVESAMVKVKVLGTRFNFKAYANDPTIEVILDEGKIALKLPEITEKDVQLKPGDRLVYEKKNQKARLSNGNIHKYIAWHTGKMIFSNTPITEVAQMLSRWYGIEVEVADPEIMNYRFTTTFENESLFQVIELLGLSSPLKIKYLPAKVGKDPQKPSKSKVIIYKKTKT